MTKQEAIIQIAELKASLEKWNYEYYVLDNPSVSDAVYDKAMQRLIFLEKEFPELKTPDSPTARVGGYVSEKFIKVKHLRPMMSLSNAFNDNELLKFDNDVKNSGITEKISYVVEPKIDGLSISLIYENSKLVRAVTRGDGVYGEDVTVNVLTIKSIPLYIPEQYKDMVVEIRGEVYMDKQDFETLNASLEENQKPFANPRNAAAGTLRNLDSSVAKERNLKALFYYMPAYREMGFETHFESIEWLRKNKFPTSDKIVHVHNINEVITQVEEYTKFRNDLDYQIDGVVIKVNEYYTYDEIGYTSKFPKWAIAYKFPAEIGLTEVINITADVGRTGKITYVAEMKPITLDGSVVSNVTLNNSEYIKMKDIRVHDWVYIYKAGDVIPYLDYVDLNKRPANSEPFTPITHCPSCQTELIRVSEEVDQRCPNAECPSQIIKAIDYFCSRDCMNIQGISISIIEKLYKENLITSIPDLYKLVHKKEQVIGLDLKIKDKSFTNIVTNIEKSKANSLEKMLTGLGIRHLGKTTAKKISIVFKTLDGLMSATTEDLLKIDDVGEILANEIIQFFNQDKNQALVQELKTLGLNTEYRVDNSGFEDINIVDAYKNKTFVITGTFSIPRNDIKNILENVYNAKVVNTISKKVDYLLTGEAGGSKLEKAQALNIPTISEEFWKK
ncbi:NAD-dependent DNA ligase LigA [Ureaplasma ceti]|uniref:DNA ligase n=1 Tax=Ureaplasma ceti TaxID=3119530 RepID=A0ABP9UAE1_9BACT